jgi:hypothetical protein
MPELPSDAERPADPAAEEKRRRDEAFAKFELEMQIRAVWRCPMPFCDRKTSLAAKRHRSAKDAAGCRDPGNRFRLCCGHHELLDVGFLHAFGAPDAPTFWTQAGRKVERRRARDHRGPL